jgi:hypothetical protein
MRFTAYPPQLPPIALALEGSISGLAARRAAHPARMSTNGAPPQSRATASTKACPKPVEPVKFGMNILMKDVKGVRLIGSMNGTGQNVHVALTGQNHRVEPRAPLVVPRRLRPSMDEQNHLYLI